MRTSEVLSKSAKNPSTNDALGNNTSAKAAIDPVAPLSKNRVEIKIKFLLNHLISDVLPKNEDGKTRMSNSDPITGQAAWYDLKVKLYKCNKNEIDGNIYPNFDTIKNKARKNYIYTLESNFFNFFRNFKLSLLK